MTPLRRRRPAGWSRGAALAGVLLTVLLVLLGAAPASAGPVRPSAPDQPAGADDAVTVDLEALTPRVVRPDGPGELVVSGRVTNTGAQPVREVGVRVQRGPALSGDRDVDRALAGDDPAEDARPSFTQVAATLDPGETAAFALRVPLRAADGLALTGPGVYPVLVNANGTPGAGTPRRVGAARLLLPVIGVPPATRGAPPAPLAVPPVGRAEKVGVLYPVVDRPRRMPVAPGAPALLADDDLAASFSPGGRLSGLVDALGRAAPLGSPAAASVCVALDADLLETAQAMTGGYRVATATGPADGRGAAAAAQWLTALRAQLPGRCVIAVPYADADLVATSRGNLADLTTYARTSGAARVAELTGTTPLADATWPADGLVDERTLSDLATGGARTVVVDGADLDDAPPGAVSRLAGPPGSAPLALATDPLLARALAGVPSGPGSIGTSPAGSTSPLGVQDALAVLVLRATASPATTGPGTVLAAPPLRWSATAAEASALLDTVTDLARLGLVTPVDAGTLAATAGPTAPPAALDAAAITTQIAGEQDSDTAISRAGEVRDDQRDLLAASQQDRAGAPTPSDFFDPLTGDLLRSLSAVARDDPGFRSSAVAAVGAQMDALRSAVRVVQPPGSYSLGSSDAPLLLTVDNRLPVAVNVAVGLSPTPGLRTSPIPVQVVPAYGSRQFQVGLQVTRTGQFSVDAQARTPGGEPLGPTSRLLLRSTAYGTITVWLTASAAVVLVILASVRIARRVRATRRDRTHRRRPAGTDPDRELQAR